MLTIERQYLHMVDLDQLTCKFVEPNWKILRWSNTKNIIFLSLMLSDCSFTMLLCELP